MKILFPSAFFYCLGLCRLSPLLHLQLNLCDIPLHILGSLPIKLVDKLYLKELSKKVDFMAMFLVYLTNRIQRMFDLLSLGRL